MRLRCMAALLFAVFPRLLLAHGDLHEQIEALTQQLLADPQNGELYLRRAELNRAHEDWAAAAADYDRAERYAPALTPVHLSRARMLLASGRTEEALGSIERFVALEPDQPQGLITRGRIQVKRGEALAAAADYDRAIERLGRAEPDVYLERAQALAAAGPEHSERALQGLEQAMAQLGPLVTFGLRAVELEVALGRIDAALARLEKLAAPFPRKESWFVRRGDILRKADRRQEAQAAYERALAAIATLAPHLRNTRATLDLETRARTALAELSATNRPAEQCPR